MPIRVLIVDDSALVRKMLASALAPEPDIAVVGTAANAFLARDRVLELNPDVITLDIEMPGMDGITFLRKLMEYKPIPVIMVSSLGHAACQASLDALSAGAVEVLAKPHGPYSIGDLGQTLAHKIRTAASARIQLPATRPRTLAPPPPVRPAGLHLVQPAVFPNCRVIAIGASTGGPAALSQLLGSLPAAVPPILIVQHMPAVFTRHLAERLDRECRIAVREAQDGDELLPGRALIAPGDRHMTLRATPAGDRVALSDGPPVCHSRPSVDVLFASVAQTAGARSIGILLTGMGHDGASSLLGLRSAGALTIAQAEASCVVFGMPREAIRLGAAAQVLTLQQIPAALLAHLARLPEPVS